MRASLGLATPGLLFAINWLQLVLLSSICLHSPYSFSFVFSMAPKRGAGRGRVCRSRGGRTPRSGRGGRRGTPPPPPSSSCTEGFWRHDFLLRVRGRSATRVLRPSSFSAIVADLGLDGLLLHL